MASHAAAFVPERISAPADTPGGKVFSMAIIGALWLFMVWLILDLPTSSYRASMLIAILSVLVFPLAIQHLRGQLDIFEPILFANIALASMFLGRPIFDISTNTWIHFWFATFFNAGTGFDDMLYYALLGIVVLQIGYFSPFARIFARKLPVIDGPLDADRAARVSFVIFLIGFLLFEEYVRQSGGLAFLAAYLTSRNLGAGFSYKSASGYLFIGPLFWPPATMVGLAAWLKSRKPSHFVIMALSMGCFFVSIAGGVGRSIAIQGIVGITIIVYALRGKRPSALVILPAVLLGLLYLTYDREARSVKTFDQKALILEHIVNNPLQQIETIWSEDDAAMCDYFSVIVANIPDRVGYGNGSTIGDVLLRAYPRFLTPNNKKPDEFMVYVFKRLFPAVYYRFHTGAADSIMGDLYADHGGFAIVLGMFFFGVVIAIPNQWLRIAGIGSLPALILFVAMPAYTIGLMRGGVPTFVLDLCITIIAVLLVGRYAQHRSHPA